MNNPFLKFVALLVTVFVATSCSNDSKEIESSLVMESKTINANFAPTQPKLIVSNITGIAGVRVYLNAILAQYGTNPDAEINHKDPEFAGISNGDTFEYKNYVTANPASAQLSWWVVNDYVAIPNTSTILSATATQAGYADPIWQGVHMTIKYNGQPMAMGYSDNFFRDLIGDPILGNFNTVMQYTIPTPPTPTLITATKTVDPITGDMIITVQ